MPLAVPGTAPDPREGGLASALPGRSELLPATARHEDALRCQPRPLELDDQPEQAAVGDTTSRVEGARVDLADEVFDLGVLQRRATPDPRGIDPERRYGSSA